MAGECLNSWKNIKLDSQEDCFMELVSYDKTYVMYRFWIRINIDEDCIIVTLTDLTSWLIMQSLRDMAAVLNSNELEGVLEDPLRFTKADSRFFYIKTSGSNVALEAMNGKFRRYKTWQQPVQFNITWLSLGCLMLMYGILKTLLAALRLTAGGFCGFKLRCGNRYNICQCLLLYCVDRSLSGGLIPHQRRPSLCQLHY